jgi:hypothetical protein
MFHENKSVYGRHIRILIDKLADSELTGQTHTIRSCKKQFSVPLSNVVLYGDVHYVVLKTEVNNARLKHS